MISVHSAYVELLTGEVFNDWSVDVPLGKMFQKQNKMALLERNVPLEQPMIDLNLLRSFVAIAETGSITRAAARLSLPKSTVSRQLARLEADLGEDLVTRGSDGVVLRDHGRRLLDRIQKPLNELDGQTPVADIAATQGHVRLMAARFIGRHVVAPALVEFAKAAPDVLLEYRAVDRFAELIPEQFDLAVTVGPTVIDGCDPLPLRPVVSALYAAPSLFVANPLPSTLADFEELPILSLCGVRGRTERITLTSATGETRSIAPAVRLEANETDVLLHAATAKLGVAVLPQFVARSLVANGELIEVLPEFVVEHLEVSLHIPRKRRNPAARQLATFLVSQLG
jgi:DNA-binding transcriptional LysR family regulator